MLAVIGYAKFNSGTAGQVNLENNPDWNRDIVGGICPQRHSFYHNRASIFPIANIYTGIFKIVEGTLGSEPNKDECMLSCVVEEDFCKYRVILVLTGLAELTLVGGWVLHGGATIYYYVTRGQEAPA